MDLTTAAAFSILLWDFWRLAMGGFWVNIGKYIGLKRVSCKLEYSMPLFLGFAFIYRDIMGRYFMIGIWVWTCVL
jgi:hypothetical protein